MINLKKLTTEDKQMNNIIYKQKKSRVPLLAVYLTQHNLMASTLFSVNIYLGTS